MGLPTALRFGPFVLDGPNQRIVRGERVLTLTPKSFAVLTYLSMRAGRLVSKQELLNAVWPNVHVGDAVLKTSVGEIRKALGDPARSPVFIETVHRRGYRFIAAVTSGWSEGDNDTEARRREVFPAAVVSRAALRLPSVHPVGRDVELGRLERCLELALEGQRQIVFVTGEPGVGKTTVVDLFLQTLEGRGVSATRGQCLALHGAGESYLPVFEALGRLGRHDDAGRVVAVLARHAPTWLAQMPSLVPPADRDRLHREILGSTPERMLREMSEALEALTTAMPLVLVLEDIHWSDGASLDLIASLARRQEPARLLVLATFRVLETSGRLHPLRAVKQELTAHGACEELALQVLTREAVDQYLAQRLAGAPVAPEVAELVHRRTDGLPVFMVSLVDYLVARRALACIDGQWRLMTDTGLAEIAVPDTVRAVIDRQLDELGDRERELLEAASVVGVEFAAAVVAEARDAKVIDVEALCQPLAQGGRLLISRGVAEFPEGPTSERYAFVHSLYRDALYQRLTATRRLALHRRIGDALERFHGAGARDVAAELATHFESGRDPARAVHYLLTAADNAAQRYANRDATSHLSRALDLLARSGATADADVRLAALERRGMVWRAMGRIDAAAADFGTLAQGAREQGRTEHEARALFYLASAVFAVDGDRCLDAAQRAVELSRDVGDELFQARTRGSSGYWHSVLRGWGPDDARACEDAVAAARRNPDRALLSLLLARASYFQRLAGSYRSALATTEESSEAALEVGDAYEYLFSQYSRAQALLLLGRWGEMVQVVAAAAHMAERNGSRLWELFFRLATASLHLHALDFERAGQLARAAVGDARAIAHPYCELSALILLAEADLASGELEMARRHLTTVAEHMDRGWPRDALLRMPLLHGLAECCLERGELDRAHQAAAELWDTAARPGERTWMALGARMLARVAVAGEERDLAQAEIRRALEVIQQADAPLAAWRVHATAGEISELHGDLDEAARNWQASAETLQQLAMSDATLGQHMLATAPARVVLARAGRSGLRPAASA